MKKNCQHCNKEFENRYKKVKFCSTECGYKWGQKCGYRLNLNTMTKKCRKCKQEKKSSDFHSIKAYRDGLHSWCKNCYSESIRNCYLVRTYGITSEQYEVMFDAQNGKCAICLKEEDTLLSSGKNKSFAVDHNHKTGQIRGLLCENCNRAIGLLKEDTELLTRAIQYINQFS